MKPTKSDMDAMRHDLLNSLNTLKEWSGQVDSWVHRSEKILPKGAGAVLCSYVKMVQDHANMVSAYVAAEANYSGETVVSTNAKGGMV